MGNFSHGIFWGFTRGCWGCRAGWKGHGFYWAACRGRTALFKGTFSPWSTLIRLFSCSNSQLRSGRFCWNMQCRTSCHTAGLDTIFVQIYMDAPPGVPGVSKNQNFLQIKLLSSCAKIAAKRHKLQKSSKLKKKCQKNPVFLDIFKYSSIWGQS